MTPTAKRGPTTRRHRRKLGLWPLLALLLALALIAAACGGDDSDDGAATTTTAAGDDGSGDGAGEGPNTPAPRPLATNESITVLYAAPIEPFASIFLADAFGEFEKENLDVTLQQIPGPDGTTLLSQGRAEVQLIGLSAGVFNQVAAGTPFKFVASTFVDDAPQAGHYIRKEYLDASGEPDYERLKGTNVAAGIGGGGWGNPGALPLWQWAQEGGEISLDDMNPITVPTASDAALALVNDSVSIAIGLTPAWASIIDSGCCEKLVDQIEAGAFMTTETFLTDRPDVADAFFRAIMRTNRTYLQGDYKTDPEVVAAMATAFNQPEDLLAGLPALGFSPDLDLAFRDVIPVAQRQFRASELLSYPDDIPADEMIDTSPVDRLLGGG